MQVVISNTIHIKDPSKDITDWVKSHLVIANPEFTKKLRMNFWLGDTPEKLFLYETQGNTMILPFGVLREILPIIGDEVSTLFPEPTVIDYGEPIPLYPYQEEAVTAALNAQYGILQSAAGSGKTQMGLAMVQKFGFRALWLTHTKDLLNQSKERAEQYMDKKLLGTITEGKVNISDGITFATIQTMSRLDLNKYSDLWDVVIVDECHRVAGSPTAMTQFYKVLNSLKARHKYGLSATVHRSDGMIQATYSLLGGIVYEVPEEAIANKIMKVGICPVGTGVKMSMDCLNTDGTINYTRLITYLTKNPERNRLIVQHLISNQNHSTLILSSRLEHLETLMAMLPPYMQREAVMISGQMVSKSGKAKREKALDEMRSGEKLYLFATYSLAKEGLDIPRLDRLFMATPEKDYAVITQSIGRIARIFDGKQDPVAYDFVDDMQYLVKNYKKRCSTYSKNGCYFVEEA